MNQDSTNKRKGKSVSTPAGTPIQQRVSQDRPPLPKRSQRPTDGRTNSTVQDQKEGTEQVTKRAGGTTRSNRKSTGQKDAVLYTSQPTRLGNDLGARPDKTVPSSVEPRPDERWPFGFSLSSGRKKSAKKNDNSVEEKTGNEPIAQSAKKRNNKESVGTRSVSFVPETDAGTVLTSVPSTPIKPATITGFTELPVKDFIVILGLWFVRFFIPWVDAWHDFNFYLLREPSYWDDLETEVRIQEVIVFCVMSVITLLVSAMADYVNSKFFIYLALHLLFVLCPLAGGFQNRVLVARAYNEGFYREWARTSHILFLWAFTITFVSFPVQLSCIFGQVGNMSRQAHYNWTAFLVFLESANRYIAFWVIPGKCPTRTFTQTAIWFLIGVLIFMVLLFHINVALVWAKPEIINSRWLSQVKVESKEQDNDDLRARKRKKLIWFSSVLTFLIINAFVFATLERLSPDEEWDKHYILSATSMFILGEILGAAFMGITLSIVRWKLQYYHQLPFLRPDVLALGLPHMINAIALIALLGRFATLSHLKEGDVIIGPIPENKKMVVEFYNFDFRNRTVCVHSTFFRPLKISPRQRGTREIYHEGVSRIYFTVTLDPRTTPSVTAADSFAYQDNTWATFVITLPFSTIRYSNGQALYNKPEIVRVEGTQGIRPKKKPQVFFMNTFVLKNTTSAMWMFLIKHSDSGFKYEFKYNLRWQAVVLEVPEGNLQIIYHLVNSTFPPQTLETKVQAVEYSVWSVVLGHARPMKKEEELPQRMLKAFKTMETAGPNSGRLPSKAQLQRDSAIMVGMTLAGMGYSGVFIGAIYLFWLDTPNVNFRTISIGVFWVLLNTPAELSKVKVIDVGLKVITVLALLQLLCTVVHFVAATHLYSPEYNFRERSD